MPALHTYAFRTIEISRPGRLSAIHPYFRDEQMSRVQDSEFFTARQIIDEHLRCQWVDLHPLRVHQFRDAFLIDGSAYLGNAIRMELRSKLAQGNPFRSLSLVPSAPRAEWQEAALVAGVAGSTWFGHWLEDEVPLQLLASHYAPPIAHVRAAYPHETPYRQLLKLPAPMRFGTARVSRLYVVDEFAQNPHKSRRYWYLRSQMAKLPKGADRVFLNRGSSGNARTLSNEEALVSRVRQEGFTIVDMNSATLDEILRALIGATLVVSVEGSHLAHALYAMARFGTIVILNPPQRTYATIADIAPFCELHAGMFICTPHHDGSFSADPDEVLSFIDETVTDNALRRGSTERFLDELRVFPIGETEF